MKLLAILTRWIFVLSLPVLFLTGSVILASNSSGLYTYGFDKYNISQQTNLADDELKKVAKELIGYFGSDEEIISLTAENSEGTTFELFNDQEKTHLKDVKNLFSINYMAFLMSFCYAASFAGVSIIFRSHGLGRKLARSAIISSGLTLLLMMALGITIMLDFDNFFYQFHVFSFANDLWKLNPDTDFLIMLFPQGFWYDSAVFVAAITAISAGALGVASLVYLRKSKSS